jgi:hypothetical protein
LSRDWFIINDEVTYKRITICDKVVELKNVRGYQYNVNVRTELVRCEREDRMGR